jgi:hypothetical protein
MTRFAALAVLVVVLVTAAPGLRVTHAESGIKVTGSTARVSFPAEVTFSLDAESGSEITEVTLLLNTPGQRYGAYTRNVRPDFSPGQRVTATWTWRRYGSSLPPGTEITYLWRLTDAAGAVLETPLASVRVDDNRFQWRELRDGLLTVRWYEGDDAFGRSLLDAATTAARQLSAEQGVDLTSPVTVHVYGSQKDLYTALPGLPPWVGGVSLGEWDSLLVPIPPRDLAGGRKTLAHELTHQLIYQITFNPSLGSRLPAWLNEGLAVVSEGPTSRENRLTLDEAVSLDHLPTLRRLGNGFSSLSGQQAQLAYTAAESVVRFLLRSEGPERMRALLAQFGEGRTADDALRRVYGRGVDETEDRWRISLGLRPLDRGSDSAVDAPEAAPARPGRTTQERWVLAAGVAAVCLSGGMALLGCVALIRRRTRTAE